jgi:hypothetical protein
VAVVIIVELQQVLAVLVVVVPEVFLQLLQQVK